MQPPKNFEEYKALYDESLSSPEGFWSRAAHILDWKKFPTQIKKTSFTSPVSINWYSDGLLNASYNCVDRHAEATPDKIALIFEGDEGETTKVTYAELKTNVNRFAKILKAQHVQNGHRVLIYMPMVPEALYTMLACAHIGAVHTVVFGGFSPESIAGRILDCEPSLLVTADEGVRGGKTIPLKANIDAARKLAKKDVPCLVMKKTGTKVSFSKKHDTWLDDVKIDEHELSPFIQNAEDPLFILYTSGSTGKPKGVLHTTGGYLTYAALTFSHIFRCNAPEDIFFCTADVGWITGHSYLTYGPLAMGATIVMYEGIPTYPHMGRFWEIIDKYKVTHFYTAPTAIRALMREGDEPVQKYKRDSLKVLGTVGEPINPEAWEWYHQIVGNKKCPIVDTWWQTETGGIMLSPQPGIWPTKPGSATLPFYGVKPEIINKEGEILTGEARGALCIADSWPGQMRTVYKNHQRFEDTYFSSHPGHYFTGDGARRDADGYYWITGRIDDVINVSGHRLGTAEIESALVAHHSVTEAAVVGIPHDIKGQGIYCYVTLRNGLTGDDALKKELIQEVRTRISPIAQPDVIHFASNLPKTRSGKIMRRILRKIAHNEADQIGDTSTLADPSVITLLIEQNAHLQKKD